MAGANLTLERLHELLHYDPLSGDFYSRKTGQMFGRDTTPEGYLRVYVAGKTYFAHRVAWFYVHGAWPVYVIDHINRIKTDNRIANLRDVTKMVNSQNRVNSKNYYFWKGRYRAAIWVDKKLMKLGSFKTEEEAKAVVLKAREQYHAGSVP